MNKEMEKININFGNLIQELKDKNLKMFVRKTKGGVIYIENNIGEIYGAGLVCIDGVYHCLYLDELLEKKLTRINSREWIIEAYNRVNTSN